MAPRSRSCLPRVEPEPGLRSSASRVIATANTPSLNASTRLVSIAAMQSQRRLDRRPVLGPERLGPEALGPATRAPGPAAGPLWLAGDGTSYIRSGVLAHRVPDRRPGVPRCGGALPSPAPALPAVRAGRRGSAGGHRPAAGDRPVGRPAQPAPRLGRSVNLPLYRELASTAPQERLSHGRGGTICVWGQRAGRAAAGARRRGVRAVQPGVPGALRGRDARAGGGPRLWPGAHHPAARRGAAAAPDTRSGPVRDLPGSGPRDGRQGIVYLEHDVTTV